MGGLRGEICWSVLSEGSWVDDSFHVFHSNVDCRVLALTIASEFAGAREDVKGSGTFLPALIDELGKLTPETLVKKAKIEVIS